MTFARTLLALLFMVAGVLHFLFTPTYVAIMPPSLPAPRTLVFLSGVCEMVGGAGLLIPATRPAAAWGLIALLIAVLPANLQMLLDHQRWPGIPQWLLWARIPMQLPLIWWAWLYTRARQ